MGAFIKPPALRAVPDFIGKPPPSAVRLDKV